MKISAVFFVTALILQVAALYLAGWRPRRSGGGQAPAGGLRTRRLLLVCGAVSMCMYALAGHDYLLLFAQVCILPLLWHRIGGVGKKTF
ncbi:MAG: hypothetical protein J5855_05805 [Mailhella sp.]|nr:hypothetical protein [Mailhella sp.]